MRALLFALLASLLWPFPVTLLAPALGGPPSSPLPLFLILPLLLAFPFLYLSRLFCGAGKVVRTGLLVFISYVVFAIAVGLWLLLIMGAMLISGASIG